MPTSMPCSDTTSPSCCQLSTAHCHSSGVRRWPVSRHKLERREHTVPTEFGPVVGKVAFMGDGSASFAPEYESCRRVSQEKNVPLKVVYDAARTAWSGAAK